MKFCPNCGAELVNGDTPFCSECGKPLNVVMQAPAQAKPEKKPVKKKSVWKKRKTEKEEKPLPTITAEIPSASVENNPPSQDDGYDGYYDDVLPLDEGSHRDGFDNELLKNIAALVIGVLVIMAASIALMYML